MPYDGLADSYLMLAEYSSLPSSDARQKAEQAVRKALQLDPLLAEAHATLASIRDTIDWDWAVALWRASTQHARFLLAGSGVQPCATLSSSVQPR